MGPFFVQGKCFIMTNQWLDMFSAKSMCQSIGAKLWEPQTLFENNEVVTKGNVNNVYEMFWIGVQKNHEGWQYTSTKIPIQYENWFPEQPNHDGLCVALQFEPSGQDPNHSNFGKWDDYDCNSAIRFICEF